MTAAGGHDVGYVRVSIYSQNTDRQLQGVQVDRVFEEKASAKEAKRPILSDCLESLITGDCLHVQSIDRLAKNLMDLQKIVTGVNDKGVSITFHKENLTFTAGSNENPMSVLMLQMLGAFSQFERSLIRERQREGIALAKKAGKQIGRKRALRLFQTREIERRVAEGEPKASLATEFGVSRQTLYTALDNLKHL